MKRVVMILGLAGLVLLVGLSPSGAQDKAKKDDVEKKKDDLDKPASSTRPAPKWVELVDLGKQDKRLAGYRAPAGVDKKVAEQEYQKAEITRSIKYLRETLGLGLKA